MLKFNSVLLLVILCGGLQLSYGEKLECEFKAVGYPFVGILYSCKVTSLDNSFDNMTIDGYTVTSLEYNNDIDDAFLAIYIHDTNTKYIPANLGSLSNLLGLAIYNSKLFEIRSKDFQGMQNLEYLSLYKNKLTSVPSDAFSSLTKLKDLSLSYNRIKYIGSGAFDQLKNLNDVYLYGNICVNKIYVGPTAITEMKKDIKVKCGEPISTQNPMEVELDAIKNELKKAKNEIQKIKFAYEELNAKLEQSIKNELKKAKNEIQKIKFAYEELNAKLTKCDANQRKSMEFSLNCDFKITNGDQYICETRDLTIHHKVMKLNEVIGSQHQQQQQMYVEIVTVQGNSLFYI